MIPDNQLARGIQSKSIRGLEAEPPVGGCVGRSPLLPDNILKTKNHIIVKCGAKSVSEHCAFFGTKKYVQTILRILNDHISKTKNRKNCKIDNSFFQIHCAPFYTKKKTVLVCMSLSRNDP